MKENKISIIIPTMDREGVFDATLSNVFDAFQEYGNFEIIVVNDSKSNTVNIPERFHKKARVISNPKKGVASARNYGCNACDGNWILFLDDDMLMNKENVTSYLNYISISEKFCVNIEWIYPPETIEALSKKSFVRFLIHYGFTSMRGWNNFPNWLKNSRISVNSIASANLFINKNHFLSTGGYDENFPFAGFEDYVFSERLKTNHFKMYVDTTSCMYHNEIDRIEPNAWYKRKIRDGATRRIAVKQGFGEVELHYVGRKKVFYAMQVLFIPIIQLLLFITSPFKFFDVISFKCYKVRLGMAIYKGYTQK